MLPLLPTILAAAALAATNAAPIRTVADALKLSAFDGTGPWPFVLEGQMYSSSGGSTTDFKDATGGYPIEDHRDGGPKPSLGDVVRISGDLIITAKGLHHFQVRRLDILGNAPLPQSITMTDANVDSPDLEYSFVRVQGVVTAVVPDDLDTNYRRMILKTILRGDVTTNIDGLRFPMSPGDSVLFFPFQFHSTFFLLRRV